MNIFDNIAKNVRKATVPAVESLTETEINGLAVAATTSEEYDTIGAAMEAIGVETAYKEDKVKKDELTDKEIQQLYEAGMEDEDPDDYEDPLAEEAIIDGYIEEAYAAEADDALNALSEEDLEDIEDDDATESYNFAVNYEDIAQESFGDSNKKRAEAEIQEKIKPKRDEINEEFKKLASMYKVSGDVSEEKLNELLLAIKDAKGRGSDAGTVISLKGRLRRLEEEEKKILKPAESAKALGDAINKLVARRSVNNGTSKANINADYLTPENKAAVKKIEDRHHQLDLDRKIAEAEARRLERKAEFNKKMSAKAGESFVGFSDEELEELVELVVASESFVNVPEENFEDLCSDIIAEEGLVDDVKKAVKDNIAEKKARNQALKDDAKTVTSSKKDVKKELEKSKALSAKDVIATTARITALIAALKAAQKSGTPIDQIDKAAKDELDWFNGIKGEWYDKLSINGDKNDTLYKSMSDIRRFKKQYEECESIIKNYSYTNYPLPTKIFNEAKELAKNEDIYVAKDFVEAWARKRGMSNPEQYAYNILKNLGGSQYATAKFTPPGVSKELFKEVVLQIPERVNSAYKACGLTVATILSGRIKAGVGFKVKDFLTAKTAKLELENAARKSLAQVKNLQKKGQDASKVIEATEDIISQLNKLGSVLEKEKNLDYAHSKYGQIIRQAKDTAETLTADLTKLKKTPVAESFSNYPSRS